MTLKKFTIKFAIYLMGSMILYCVPNANIDLIIICLLCAVLANQKD